MPVANSANLHKTSYLIKDQVPDFVRADHPNFVFFLEKYYEFLQTANTGVYDSASNTYSMGPTYFFKSSLEHGDVDTDLFDRFIDNFKAEFAPNIPKQLDAVTDKSLFYKNILSFYRSKGTENSFKMLFRLLYGEEIELYYPNRDILTLSGGSFSPEVRVRLATVDNIEDIVGRRIYGANSGVYATVERIERTHDNINFPWRDPADRDDSIIFAYLNKFSIGNTTTTQTEFDIDEIIYTGNTAGNHVNTVIHASPIKTIFYDDFSKYANVNYMLAPSDNRGSSTESIERSSGEYSLATAFSSNTGAYSNRWYDRWGRRGANIYSYISYGASNNYVNPAISFVDDTSASGGKVLVIGNDGATHGPILDGSLSTEDRVNLIHNDNIPIDKSKLYKFSARVKDPHSDSFDLDYRYGGALQFNSGYSALGSDGESYIKSGYVHPGDHFVLSSEYPSGAMSANGADLTGNNPSWTTDWRVFQSYVTGSGAGQLAGHGNVMEFSNTAASNFEYPRRVFSYPNETASFGADTTYIRPIIDIENSHNYVHRAYSVFDAPVSSYEIEESPSASNTYPIHIHGSGYGGGWSGYINTTSTTITACTDGFSTANSFEVEIIDDPSSTSSAWAKAAVFANAHIYTRSAFVSNTTYNKDAPFIIQIPKGKRWVLSYYASTNNHTETECRMEVWFKDSTQPSSNIFMITDGAPTNSADAGFFHATDTWERRHLVFNFANTTSPILGDGTTDETNVVLVEHFDQGPNNSSTFSGGIPRFAKDRTSSDTAADPWSGDTYAANVDTILLKLASANSSGAYGTVSVRVAGIQLEEAANNTTVNASPFRSQGDDSGGSQIYVDYYKIEEMGTIEPLTATPHYLDESSLLSTKGAVSQDNHYFQQYAYDIRTQQEFKTYTSVVESAVHPAGFKKFGTKLSDSSANAALELTETNQSDTFMPNQINSLAGWWSADSIVPDNIQWRRWATDITSNGIFGTNVNRISGGITSGPSTWEGDVTWFTGDRLKMGSGDSAEGLGDVSIVPGISPLGGEYVLRLTENHTLSIPLIRLWGSTDTFNSYDWWTFDRTQGFVHDDYFFDLVLEPNKKWLVSCYAKVSNTVADTTHGSWNTLTPGFIMANTTGAIQSTYWGLTGGSTTQGMQPNFSEPDTWQRIAAPVDLSDSPYTRGFLILRMPDRRSFTGSTGNTVLHVDGIMIEEYNEALHGAVTGPYTPSPYVGPGMNGANVVSWYDQSVNKHHVYANTHGGIYYPPQFVANAINGKPAIRFAANTVKNTANVYENSAIGGTVNALALSLGDSTAKKPPTAILQATTMMASNALSRPVSNAWTIMAVGKRNLNYQGIYYGFTYKNATDRDVIFNSGYNGDTWHSGDEDEVLSSVSGSGGSMELQLNVGADHTNPRLTVAVSNASMLRQVKTDALHTTGNHISPDGWSNNYCIYGVSEYAGTISSGDTDTINFHFNGRRWANSGLSFSSDMVDKHTIHDGIVWDDQIPYRTSIGGWAPSNNQIFDTGTGGVNQKYIHGHHNWDGEIAEILVFNEKLSNTNIALVEGYLAWKYGLQANLVHKDVSGDHPYRYQAPSAVGANNTPY